MPEKKAETKPPSSPPSFEEGLQQLEAIVKDEHNKPYERVMYYQDSGLKWNSGQSIGDTKSMEDLSLWLKERATNPDAGGGIKDKDMKDKK